ncbi:MAG: iron-sulfur cluster assembly scaffold protein [Candidatus Thermoplasmatota archaeon]|jgi:nitrogen fixation NifU-like protein|nr:iron-sulfur cluster assembly scaffold protein [Candidatus Thermoplasmatota archaeon]
MSDDIIYSAIIDEHYEEPRNFGKIEDPDEDIMETNPTCGDTIAMYLRLGDGKIREIKYVARGCLISVASASILSERVSGKDVSEVLKMSKNDILSYLGLDLGPAREKCALLSYDALIKMLRKYEKEAKK